MSKPLPWSQNEYTPLAEADLAPTPPPTPEQRLRVAATLATLARDRSMRGEPPTVNSEAIRSVLTMSDEAWARDAVTWSPILVGRGFDPVDPKTRFEQTAKFYGRR